MQIITLNINSAYAEGKREEMKALLSQEKPDILCLQETRQRAAHWPLRFKGFKTYAALGAETASTRGLALLVGNRFLSESVGRPSPFWLFVKVHGGNLSTPLIVGTVYVPPIQQRGRIFNILPGVLEELKAEYPSIPILLAGDYNMPLHSLQQELNRRGVVVKYTPSGKVARRKSLGCQIKLS